MREVTALDTPDLASRPTSREFALRATNDFQNPDEIVSNNGILRATLVLKMAHNTIGADPVYLRSYNGKLVGPTLRAHPGDKLLITLKNELPPDPDPEKHNTFYHFNTTNLHTHADSTSLRLGGRTTYSASSPLGRQQSMKSTLPDHSVRHILVPRPQSWVGGGPGLQRCLRGDTRAQCAQLDTVSS